MIARAALALSLLGALAGCGRSAQTPASPAGPAITLQEYMEEQINPAGEAAFRSVREVADAKGHRLEQPRTDAEWKSVEARLAILRDAPKVLTAPGLKAAPPGFKSENPSVENEPAQIQAAIDAGRDDFNHRAWRLSIAASEALLAAQARDAIGLVKRLDDVDRACESCHLRYFYPGDRRAQQAARGEYVMN